MNSELNRKEVHLRDGVIARLQALADKKGWSLKKYMEWALERASMKGIQTAPETRNK